MPRSIDKSNIEKAIENDYSELLARAWEAQSRAYAPYSGFPVGAALLAASGRIYTGCNVENGSYGLAMCAERVALFSAVCAGERAFTALAVVADSPSIATPCGACRQALAEFGQETIIIAANKEKQSVYTLRDLLPYPFVLK